MSVARITVFVREDTALGTHALTNRSGEARGWLEVGDGMDLALCGSAVALRRLAVAVRDAAKAAEERHARGERVGEPARNGPLAA
jgi:hypothetical protein